MTSACTVFSSRSFKLYYMLLPLPLCGAGGFYAKLPGCPAFARLRCSIPQVPLARFSNNLLVACSQGSSGHAADCYVAVPDQGGSLSLEESLFPRKVPHWVLQQAASTQHDAAKPKNNGTAFEVLSIH